MKAANLGALVLSLAVGASPALAGSKAAAQAPAQAPAGGTPEAQRADEAAPAVRALDRSPAELPRSEPGRWDGWTPETPIPDVHRASMGASLQAYSARDYPGTLAALYGLLEREPDFPPALYQAATALFRMRRYGDCVLLLERFLEVVPAEVGATQALGHSLYSLGQYERARDHYARVLGANPDSAEAVRGLGLAHMRLGDNAKALEQLERVVELRPAHAEAHGWIAHVHFDEGDLEAARAACERSIELSPSTPRTWFLMSGIRSELGDETGAAEARARFEELSKLQQELLATQAFLVREPRSVPAVAALVNLHVRRQDTNAALRALERLVTLEPNNFEVRMLVLDTLVAVGDTDNARLAAFELEQRFANRVEAWERLEVYWASVGDITRQIQAGERHRRMRSSQPTGSE